LPDVALHMADCEAAAGRRVAAKAMLATGLAQHIKDVAGEVGWLEEDVYTFMDVTLCLSSSPATFVARGGPPLVIAKSAHPPRLVDLHAAAAPRLQRQYHQLACYHMLACMARQLPPLVQLEGAGVYLTAHGWSYAASRSESMEQSAAEAGEGGVVASVVSSSAASANEAEELRALERDELVHHLNFIDNAPASEGASAHRALDAARSNGSTSEASLGGVVARLGPQAVGAEDVLPDTPPASSSNSILCSESASDDSFVVSDSFVEHER
jgi:hypothetical protein